MKYYVFIVTSRDDPLYEQFDNMRREQMKAIGIHYKFLLNGKVPDKYLLKDDEEYYPNSSFTPGMFVKFYNACKNLKGDYGHIVRVNSSTFINFQELNYLELPKYNFFGGPVIVEKHVPYTFISGTVMIFSKDVINRLINEIPINNNISIEYPDDVAISYILTGILKMEMTQMIDKLIVYSEVTSESYNIYLPDRVLFIRVRNEKVREKNDIYVWKELMRLSGIKLISN